VSAYYNEFDPFAAAWLRELIKAGHIAPGDVDERSIEDVKPDELRGYTQCHFFAGIGVWSYALRSAGWPDDRPVWTGSCPCQPFSAAGKRGGTADARHLWPALFHLLRECKPATFFGEQVASKDGLAWFDTVQSDLEGSQYTVGAADLCSAGFGAPHIRQRLYFVGSRILANAESSRRRVEHTSHVGSPDAQGYTSSDASDCFIDRCRPESDGGLAYTDVAFTGEEREQRSGQQLQPREDEGSGIGLAHNNNAGLPERISNRRVQREALGASAGEAIERCGLTNGFWREAEWIPCRDGKYRPIEPSSPPLATGITNRVGKLRGYGNALTAPVAQGFIEAFLEAEREAVSEFEYSLPWFRGLVEQTL
jgi:DNA (cytosine-5)-methyltransferase 1